MEKINNFTQNLISFFENHADPEYARAMSAYMKNRFTFFGIKSPDRKTLFQEFLKQNKIPKYPDLFEVIHDIYTQPKRELHYLAIEMLEKTKKQWQVEDIVFFEYLITTNSWWDSVDGISTNIIGNYFIKYPEQIRPITEGWMVSNNMWLQRVCLIFQLKYNKKTDFALMSAYILRLKDSNEFFIQKAIGWALRQYAKFNPDAVQDFVETHTLKSLSEREALKHIAKK